MVRVASRTASENDTRYVCYGDLRNEEDNRESNNGRCNAHGNTSTQNGNKRERTGYNDEHATVVKNCARKGPTTHGADVEHTQEQRDNQAEHQVRGIRDYSAHRGFTI